MAEPMKCRTCDADLPGGVESCPVCQTPLVPSSSGRVSAMTWRTPDTTKAFDAVCPWCGKKAEDKPVRRVISSSRACACGAVALGAPARDFDEVVDDAINHFEILGRMGANRHWHPERWLKDFGIDFREGGRARPPRRPWEPVAEAAEEESAGDTIFFYWFKRVSP